MNNYINFHAGPEKKILLVRSISVGSDIIFPKANKVDSDQELPDLGKR